MIWRGARRNGGSGPDDQARGWGLLKSHTPPLRRRGGARDTGLSLMHCDRLQGPINLSISLSFLREAHDYHLLGHQERSPSGLHTAHAPPAGSHQEVRREPANTFPVIFSPPQNDFPWRGWGRGGGRSAGVLTVPTPGAAGRGAAGRSWVWEGLEDGCGAVRGRDGSSGSAGQRQGRPESP